MDNFASHSIPFTSPIFTLATHPSSPLFTAGLLSGHVYTYTWPQEIPSDDSDSEGASNSLPGGYKVAWKTRRHKGSCRSAAYSHDGQALYTAGTDSLIKVASTTTGQVTQKALIPPSSSTSQADNPSHIHPLTPHHLLLGTDAGTIHLYDTRVSLPVKPTLSWTSIHEDYISSISPLPPTSESTSNLPKSLITTGDTTLAVVDVRKGLMQRSEDQENELLSSCVVNGVGKGGRSTRVYAGMSSGTIHAFERGVWTDMCERIKIGGKDTEVDVVAEYTQTGDEEVGKGKCIAAGCSDGIVRVVRLGGNKIVRMFEHGGSGEEEGISAIGFDCDGSMVTAGGSTVKIWYQENDVAKLEDDEEEKRGKDKDSDDSDEDSDGDSDGSDEPPAKGKTRKFESDSDDSDQAESSKSGQRRKKRQKNKHHKVAKKPQFSGLD
ncbi:hypothetical protein ABW19_dt0205514 [Dactylella cylindrospora]|nr:hypothetical protein ABW19_dt0205514 [Dactylella cylindrospora]